MDNIIKHEANSIPVGQRQADGYINATAMCKAAGKRLSHYMENQQTKEYLDALACSLNVGLSVRNPLPGIPATEIIQVFQGGDLSVQGTWVHPQVAVHLGMWLSPEFAVQVTKWVMDWMTGKQTPSAPQPEQKLFGPSHYYPEVSQAVFDSLPYLDRLHMAESPAERAARLRREGPEIWGLQ